MMKRNRTRGVSSKFQVGAVLAMAVVGVTGLLRTARAADVQLQDTNLTLTDPGAWVGGVAPTPADVAVFGSTLTGAVNNTYSWTVGTGTNNSWLGISVLNPGGNISVTDTNGLTLGGSGINMSSATRDLNLNAPLTLITNQTWSIASGRTLAIQGPVSLAMNATNTAASLALVVTGAGIANVSGVISGGTLNTFTVNSLGTVSLSGANTFTGITQVRSGKLALDFSAGGAPTSQILSSNSLQLGGGTFTVIGNPSNPVTQSFNTLQFLAGLTTIDMPSSGAGVSVNFGAWQATGGNNNGAMVRVVPVNTVNTTLTLTSVPTNGLGSIMRSSVQGAIATWGLYDFAATKTDGTITYVGDGTTVNYVGAAPGNFGGDDTNVIDIQGGGAYNFNQNVNYSAIRFDTNSSSQDVNVSNNGRVGAILMTPNVGARNVTVSGTNMRTLNANNANGQINFWQNNEDGTLTISAVIGGSGGGYSLAKAGKGLVVFTTGDKSSSAGIFIYEGELRATAANQLGTADGSLVNLMGGTLGVSASFTNSNGGAQHPILVGVGGGGINVLTGSTFTISNSSNTAITGSGILTKWGGGTMVLSNTASNWTGGLAVNEGLVSVTPTIGTPVGSGPVSINSGGSLTVSGIMSNGLTVNSGGTWVVNNGTVGGAITLNPGAIVSSTGSAFSPLTVTNGAIVSPGNITSINTFNFQSLALNSSSVLNMTLQAVPKSSDNINILTGGSLSLGSGIVVNMFNATSGIPFIANGSYTLFTGVDVITAGKYAGGATSGILTNFITGNLATSGGASAVFSLVNAGTSSNIVVTITGGLTVATLTRLGVPGNWQDNNNWDTAAPGNVVGDIASLASSTAPTTMNLNGQVKLGTLGIDSGTNSGGYTIAAGTGPGKLYSSNGTLNSLVSVGTGVHEISADYQIDSPTTFSMTSSAGSLTVTGLMANNGTNSAISIAGPGRLILAANNSIATSGSIAANGTLQFGNGGAAGAWGTGTITNSGTLAVNRTGTYNLSSLAGRVTGAGTLTNAGANGNLVWDYNITSGGFTGLVNVAAGTVTVGAGGIFTAGLAVGSAGRFDANGNNMTLSSITNAGVITNAGAAPATIQFSNAAAATLGGSITNGASPLSLVKTGGGLLTLNGVNSFTGEFVINAGTVNVTNSTALPAGSTAVINVTNPGINLSNGVNLGANVWIGRDAATTFYTWEVPNGVQNVTFSGNMFNSGGSQFRVRVLSAGTATITGAWSATSGSFFFLTQGNFVFDGPTAMAIAGNGTNSQPIQIGRSEAAGEVSRNTNVTLRNGASWINNSFTGTGIQIGATGQTNAVQTLTVDHSYININTMTIELEGQTTASNLNLIGGTITAGGFTKANTGATIFTFDGGMLLPTQANAAYIPQVAGLTVALGSNGGTINTTASNFNLGIGAPIVTGTTGAAGDLVILGAGVITLSGTGSTYNGSTILNTASWVASAADVFSPNSALKVYNTGSVTGGGFNQGVGGLDDTAGTPGNATGFANLTINVGPGKTYTFAGNLGMNGDLTKSGPGTQILTGAISGWTGNTTLSGGKLRIGSASTNGLTITTGGIFTFGPGDSTFESVMGTAGSAGFTAGSLGTRLALSAGNFSVPDGVNGTTNFIKFNTFTAGFVDHGTFFNGADYAYIDGIGFVRAPSYGVDGGFSAANTLAAGTHVLVTGGVASGSASYNTIKFSGGAASMTQGGGSISVPGLLKSGGGTATISGGTLQSPNGGFSAAGDFIVRADAASDVLVVNSQILDNSTTPLIKSGDGTVKLGAINTFTGKTYIYNGTLSLAHAQALQSSILVYPASSGVLGFSGITAATLPSILSSSGDAHSLNLVNDAAAPVALTINYTDIANTLNLFTPFTGTGTFVKDGAGRIDLQGLSTHTGGVTLLAGTLSANGASIPNGATITSLGTGTLSLTGGIFRFSSAGDHNVILANTVLASGNAEINTSGTVAVTLSGNLAGSGTLTRSGGSGVLNFTSTANSAFHGTFINSNAVNNVNNIAFASTSALPATDSTWILSSPNSMVISSNGNSTVGFGAVSGTVSGATLAINNVNTSGAITTTLNLGFSNVDTTFAGAITQGGNGTNSNTVTLVKVGTGRLQLSGTGSNYGGLSIQQGVLATTALDNATAVGFIPANPLGVGSTLTIAGSATLQYVGSGHSSLKFLSLGNNAVLDASGTGAASFNNSGSISWDAVGVARSFTLAGNSTAQNTLAARVVNNGAGAVSLVKNGTSVWSLTHTSNTFTGGTTINGGLLLMSNTTGNAGGTALITVNNSGGIGGSGTTTAPVLVNSGGRINAGPYTGNRIGTLNLGSTLTLAGGSIIDVDISAPGIPNDLINFTGSGSLNITGGANTIGINLLNAGQTTNYFYNGTYALFTGIVAAASNHVATNLSSLFIANEGGTGGSFVISQSTVNGNAILVTVSNAWANASWTNGDASGQWRDSPTGLGAWIGGVPNGSGHIATFGTNVANAGTVSMVGNKSVNNLTFNNTNSYTINASVVSDTLSLVNGTTNVATLAVVTGNHTVNPNIVLSAPLVNVNVAATRVLTLNGSVTGAGSLSLTGSGSLILGGAANPGGGTTIGANAVLIVGNGATGGSLAGPVNYAGTLTFRRGDNISYDLNNLNQTASGGTFVQAGTGNLTIFSSVAGSVVPDQIVVNAGRLVFGASFLTDASQSAGDTALTINAPGTVDLNGTEQYVRAFNGTGVLDNFSATAGTIHLSSTGAQAFSGRISDTGVGNLSIVKDGSGVLTLSGTMNNAGTLTILSGQIVYTNTVNTSMGGQIVMARTTTGSAGLLLGAGANVTSPIFVTAAQGNTEFLSTSAANTTASFSGNVTVDSGYFGEIRVGNYNTGTLNLGGTLTIPTQNTLTVSRGTVATTGLAKIDHLVTFSPLQIGVDGTAVTFINGGSSSVLTYTGDGNFNTGIRLGAAFGTATGITAVHTIQDTALVRVGLNGASDYDLQSSSVNEVSTLNLNGGTLALGRFYMSGLGNFGFGGGAYPRADVVFNGGTVKAGLDNNDMTMGTAGPLNMKFTVSSGGATLDLNSKTGVTWTKPLTSNSTGSSFSDGGLAYVSRPGTGTITLATRQLYAGRTTIGTGATVLVSSSDLLGMPSAGGALNFSGGVMRMTQSFNLSSVDNGTSSLTHRYSFNDNANPMTDSVTGNTSAGQLNSNATVSGGVLSMRALANSSASSLLSLSDQIGGTNTPYTANGVTFAVWYTPLTQTNNAVLFSLGSNSPFSAGSPTIATPLNYLELQAANGANIRSIFNPGTGGDILNAVAAPATGSQHLAVVTIDASNITLFIDGVMRLTNPLSSLGGGQFLQNLQNGGGIMLGGSQASVDPSFNGSIDEFRVYSSVLNPGAISAMSTAGPNSTAFSGAVNRNVTVDTAGGTLDLAGFTLGVAGNVSGTGTLTLANGGSLVLTGSSSAGLIVPSTVQLLVGTGGSQGALTGGNITNSSNIIINRNDAAGVMGATITGGTVTFAGTGTTTVTAPSLPRVNLNAGALVIHNNLTVQNGINLTGGTALGFDLGTTSTVLSIGGTGYSNSGVVNLLTPGFNYGFGVGEYTVITGAAGSLAGQFNAPAASGGYTYTLDTSTAGTLAIIVGANFNTLYWRGNTDTVWSNNNWSTVPGLSNNSTAGPQGPTSVIFNNTNSAVANLTSAGLVNDLTFAGTGGATIGGTGNLKVMGAAGITMAANSGPVTISTSGGLTANSDQTWTNNGTNTLTIASTVIAGSLILAGAGTIFLASSNTFTTGANITGKVKIGAADSLGNKPFILGGTLDLNGVALSIGTITGSGVMTSSATGASSITSTISSGVTTYAFSVLDGTGVTSVTKAGSGTLVLSGANTYSGNTALNGGRLVVGATNALSANSSIVMAASTTLDLNGFSTSTGALSSAAGSALVTNSGASAATLTVNATAGASTTYSGVIQNGTSTVSLVKTGTGRLDLGTANTFTGGVTLLDGTLSATGSSNGATLASLGTGTLILTGGTFRGQPSGNNNFVLTNPVLANGNAQLNTSGSANGTFAGNLSGTGALVKTGGTGNITFTGANSGFHGTLAFDSSVNSAVGNMVFVAPSAYPASDFNLTMNASSSATFNSNVGTSVGIATLSGNNPSAVLAINSTTSITSTLTLGSAVSSTFLGSVSPSSLNTMTLVKVGSGTLNLGSNAFTSKGAINVSAGRLAFGNSAGTRQTAAVLIETSALTNSSTLDLGNRDMMIHSGSAAAFEAQITNAYNFGSWDLAGITSATAAASGGVTSLGIMSGDDYNNFSPNTGSFDGKVVTSADTIIKYTYAGDINLEGMVDDNDLFQFLGEYQRSQTGNYALGDMTYDGLVNDDDLFLFLGNYLNQPAQPLSTGGLGGGAGLGGGSAAVPEPTSLALLGIGAAGLLLRRKKQAVVRRKGRETMLRHALYKNALL